jgi:hypothetical protein
MPHNGVAGVVHGWAVCPSLAAGPCQHWPSPPGQAREASGSEDYPRARDPQFFKTLSSAERWLFSDKTAAPPRGLSRAEHKANRRLPGWSDPIPVRRLRDHPRKQLTTSNIRSIIEPRTKVVPTADLASEMDRLDRPPVECFLALDWDFNAVEADARQRAGRIFGGDPEKDCARLILDCLADLERSLTRVHDKIPASAVAEFWRSYQVRKYMFEVCEDLSDHFLGRTPDSLRDVYDARVHIESLLYAYALELSPVPTACGTGGESDTTVPEWVPDTIRELCDRGPYTRISLAQALRMRVRNGGVSETLIYALQRRDGSRIGDSKRKRIYLALQEMDPRRQGRKKLQT